VKKVPAPRKQLAMGTQPRKMPKAQKRALVQKETRAPRKAKVTKGRARKKLLQLKAEKARKKEKVQKTLPPPERIQHQQVPKATF